MSPSARYSSGLVVSVRDAGYLLHLGIYSLLSFFSFRSLFSFFSLSFSAFPISSFISFTACFSFLFFHPFSSSPLFLFSSSPLLLFSPVYPSLNADRTRDKIVVYRHDAPGPDPCRQKDEISPPAGCGLSYLLFSVRSSTFLTGTNVEATLENTGLYPLGLIPAIRETNRLLGPDTYSFHSIFLFFSLLSPISHLLFEGEA